MRRRKSRDVEIFNMSFLDVISCGFGAVILLLVVALAFEPQTVERLSRDLRGLISQSEREREALTAESQELAAALAEKKKSLAALAARIEALDAGLKDAQQKQGAAELGAREREKLEDQLRIVQQRLSDEMKRLLSQPDYRPPRDTSVIGGIPVDSEYVIFVIDTSGSMKKGAWPLVLKKMEEILDSYPKLKGLQVMNDMGTYMFPLYAGQWIPDTPSRRSLVLARLATWDSFSNSSPVEGLYEAISRYYRPDRPTSVFVFGDDFNGRSIDQVIEAVTKLNRKAPDGKSQVRIHTFGYPVLPLLTAQRANFIRFAHLMRLLAEQNSGSFVGLNSLR
jgi:hypothetical protein